MDQLLEIMARLRDPESGCPWDLEQTFQSIAPHTIEEAYEVAEAIRRGDMSELKDELGDLLFQVVFYSQLAGEQGDFQFEDVVQAISDKMLRRHPHVFGDINVSTVAEQTLAWEQHKAEERGNSRGVGSASALEGVALALPALSRAEKLQKRAARVGFDWPALSGVMAKIDEEMTEIQGALENNEMQERLVEEVGDLLFSCVNLARHLGVDAEGALRQAGHKFERRFRAMESCLLEQGKGLAEAQSEELEELWERVKSKPD